MRRIPFTVESNAVIESDHRRSRARGGRQGLGGDRAVVAKIHAFDDRSRRTSGIDAGRQSQHRERADAPRFTGSNVTDIKNDHGGAVIEVAVPIGDVDDAIVRQGGDAEGIVIHRHGDVGQIDIESARCIRRGRMVQGQRAIKRHPDARVVRRIDRRSPDKSMFVEERIADLQQLVGGQSGDVAGVAADNDCIVAGVRILGQMPGLLPSMGNATATRLI